MRKRVDSARGRGDTRSADQHSTSEKVWRTRFRKGLRVVLLVISAFVGVSALLILCLRWIDPPVTAFMLQDDSGVRPVMHEWVKASEMGVEVGLAVIASEDQRFAHHRGFDLDAIQTALAERREGRRLRGASTLTQQLAKNLFLWPGRSMLRKGLEVWSTALLELFLSKPRILELYLNAVEFGPGTYGVGAAGDEYFSLNPGSFSAEQAALLAAVLPSPKRFSVRSPSEYMRERQRWIVDQMTVLRRDRAIQELLYDGSFQNRLEAQRLLLPVSGAPRRAG